MSEEPQRCEERCPADGAQCVVPVTPHDWVMHFHNAGGPSTYKEHRWNTVPKDGVVRKVRIVKV